MSLSNNRSPTLKVFFALSRGRRGTQRALNSVSCLLLNKGEARNALARAIFFYRLGEMRDRSFESQVYRASGLNLLIAAIILWNTRYLEQTFVELERQGVDVSPTIVAHVAPLGWEHIGLTGDYVWSDGEQPPKDVFRPLRRRKSMLAA